MTESQWVERHLGRSVVKAFNNIRAQHLLERGRRAGRPDRIALPVSGDNPAAKNIVLRLVEELGFDPIDAGPISHEWSRDRQGRPFIQPTSMPKAFAGPCSRRVRNGLPSSVQLSSSNESDNKIAVPIKAATVRERA